jgi:hypothetical protein
MADEAVTLEFISRQLDRVTDRIGAVGRHGPWKQRVARPAFSLLSPNSGARAHIPRPALWAK